MLETFMYLMSNAFKIHVITKFYEHFFTPKDISKWWRYLAFVGFFLLNSGLYLFLNNNYLNLLSNIIPLFLITYLYSIKWQNRIFFPMIILAVLLFLEGFFYNISQLLFDNPDLFNINIETSLSLYLLELLLEHKKMTFSNNHNIKRLHFIAIISVVGGSLLIGTITMQDYNIYIVIVTITLFIINIVIFSLYDIISKTEQQLYEKKLLEQQNIAYNNQIKLWEENRKATQTLRHDMKNHLVQILITLDNQDYSQLREYILQMQTSLDIKDEFIKTGNISVDSILNYKLKKIQTLTKNLKYDINIPENVFISNFDFNIILGNLLDNSIEALLKCEENSRFFHLQMDYMSGMLKISVINTYNGVVHKKGNIFKSTKDDDKLHGIGIESVKNTISKYNGVMNFYTTQNTFRVKIILCENQMSM